MPETTVIRPFTQSRIKIEQGPGKVLVYDRHFFGENVLTRHDVRNFSQKEWLSKSMVLTSDFYEFCAKATWRDDFSKYKEFVFDFVFNYTESLMGMGEASTNRQVGQRLLTSPSFAEIRK